MSDYYIGRVLMSHRMVKVSNYSKPVCDWLSHEFLENFPESVAKTKA